MEGAFEAMGTGEVDVNWAKQHHSLWLEEEIVPRQGPAEQAGRWARRPNSAAQTRFNQDARR